VRRYPVVVSFKVSEEDYRLLVELSGKVGVRTSTLIRKLISGLLRSIKDIRVSEEHAIILLDLPVVVVVREG
jgi:hypothetical protein